jgi:hypothetical protein
MPKGFVKAEDKDWKDVRELNIIELDSLNIE